MTFRMTLSAIVLGSVLGISSPNAVPADAGSQTDQQERETLTAKTLLAKRRADPLFAKTKIGSYVAQSERLDSVPLSHLVHLVEEGVDLSELEAYANALGIPVVTREHAEQLYFSRAHEKLSLEDLIKREKYVTTEVDTVLKDKTVFDSAHRDMLLYFTRKEGSLSELTEYYAHTGKLSVNWATMTQFLKLRKNVAISMEDILELTKLKREGIPAFDLDYVEKFISKGGTIAQAKEFISIVDKEGIPVLDGEAIVNLRKNYVSPAQIKGYVDYFISVQEPIPAPDLLAGYAGSNLPFQYTSELRRITRKDGTRIFSDEDIFWAHKRNVTITYAQRVADYARIRDRPIKGADIILTTRMHAFISGKNLSHMQWQEPNGKPNALIILPETDYNGAFVYNEGYLQKLQSTYNTRIVFAGKMQDVYDALKEAKDKNVELLAIGGHGSGTSVTLGRESKKDKTADPGSNHKLEVGDPLLHLYLHYLALKAVVFLDSCENGEEEFNEKNLADFIHIAANRRTTIAAKTTFSHDDLKITSLYPFDALVVINHKREYTQKRGNQTYKLTMGHDFPYSSKGTGFMKRTGFPQADKYIACFQDLIPLSGGLRPFIKQGGSIQELHQLIQTSPSQGWEDLEKFRQMRARGTSLTQILDHAGILNQNEQYPVFRASLIAEFIKYQGTAQYAKGMLRFYNSIGGQLFLGEEIVVAKRIRLPISFVQNFVEKASPDLPFKGMDVLEAYAKPRGMDPKAMIKPLMRYGGGN